MSGGVGTIKPSMRDEKNIDERTTDVLDSFVDPILSVDKESRIVHVNNATERFFKIDKSELVGKSVWDVLPKNVQIILEFYYHKALSEGKPSQYDNLVLFDRRCNVNFYPSQKGLTIFIQDNTTKWQTEELYRLSLFLLDRLNESVFLVRSDGRLFHVNDEIGRLLGYSRNELIHMKIFDIDPSITVDGWESYFTRIKDGVHVYFESSLMAKDGKIIPVDVSANYFDLYGDKYYCVAARDITERKQAEVVLRERTRELEESEQRFRATFEQAAVGIAQLDPDGRFIRINERYCDIVGYTHDEMLERTFQDITYPADLDEDQRNVQRLLDGEIATYAMEKRYVRKDGSLVWVYLTVSLEHNEDGSPKYLIAVVEDITERKQAEEALRESEERFRQLADNSPISMAINDTEDNITYLNKKFIEIFGYTLKDIPRLKYWWSLAYPDPVYREDAIKRWEKVVEEAVRGSREIGPIDYTVTCKDGSVRNIEISGVPIGDKELVLLQDVTERKRAVEALRKSESSLAKAQRITHMGNYVLDLKKDWAICSDEFYKILGIALQDHFSYKSYLARVHPDDREMFDNVVQEAIAQGKTFSTDSRIVRPDGDGRVVHAEGEMVLDKSGRSIQMFGTIQDITERKQAEDALRTSEANLANAQRISHIGNWVWDTKRDEVRCSNEFYRIFGIDIREFITYEQFINMLNPQDREPVNKAVDAALYMGVPYRIDYRVIWPDGSEHIIHAEAEVNFDGAGKPISMFGTVQDITEQRLAEIELQKAKAMVEMYNDLLGHDINNINQVGIGYLEMAIDTLGLSDEGKKLLSKPLEALINSSKLIENVRKLQHIKSGDVGHKVMNVNQVLLDVKNSYSNVEDRSIVINYSPVSGCLVEANELLRDVFSNLVENAIKHSTGMLEINIGVTSVFDDGREYCRVSVEDNGPGIPDSIRDKLFMRFQRGNTKASGKGLGLFIVKSLVEDYHGKIWVEDRIQSDYTKGARFIILLPAADN